MKRIQRIVWNIRSKGQPVQIGTREHKATVGLSKTEELLDCLTLLLILRALQCFGEISKST